MAQLAMEKEDAKYIQEIGVEMYRIQEQLAKLQTRLDDHHQASAQAEGKHQQAQDQLEAMKSQYSCITGQNVKAKAHGETDWQCGGLALVLNQDYISFLVLHHLL